MWEEGDRMMGPEQGPELYIDAGDGIHYLAKGKRCGTCEERIGRVELADYHSFRRPLIIKYVDCKYPNWINRIKQI